MEADSKNRKKNETNEWSTLYKKTATRKTIVIQ